MTDEWAIMRKLGRIAQDAFVVKEVAEHNWTEAEKAYRDAQEAWRQAVAKREAGE